MSKAVTFLCPNCRSKIKTLEPIGMGINVRACGECDHTYYVQALDDTHCRMSMAASQTRVGYEPEFIKPNFGGKTKFTYSAGGRSAGKAYKAAKAAQEFFSTRYAEANPDIVEDAEFVVDDSMKFNIPPEWVAGFDFGSGESSTGHFTKRDPFMPEGGPWEPTQKFKPNDGQGLHDAFFGKPTWRDQILNGEWIVAEPNRKPPEEIKEIFDNLRGAADRLKEAMEKLTNPKPGRKRGKKR